MKDILNYIKIIVENKFYQPSSSIDVLCYGSDGTIPNAFKYYGYDFGNIGIVNDLPLKYSYLTKYRSYIAISINEKPKFIDICGECLSTELSEEDLFILSLSPDYQYYEFIKNFNWNNPEESLIIKLDNKLFDDIEKEKYLLENHINELYKSY